MITHIYHVRNSVTNKGRTNCGIEGFIHNPTKDKMSAQDAIVATTVFGLCSCDKCLEVEIDRKLKDAQLIDERRRLLCS